VESSALIVVSGVGDTGPETTSELSGISQISSRGGAENGAFHAELLAVVKAWPALAPHSRAIILGIARKAMAEPLS
jgi:hypothetical protein